MSITKKQFFRLRVIDEELRRNSWVKTSHLRKVINDKLLEDVSEKTIQNDINAMKYDTRLGFDAPIEYDRKKKAYYYSDRDYSITKFSLHAEEIAALKFYASCVKIYSEYGIFKDFSNAIKKIVEGVSIKHALKRQTNPQLIVQTDTVFDISGTDFLAPIIHAIDEKTNLEIVYKKFSEDEGIKRVVSPYLLKEYKNRWYLLGADQKDSVIKTFGLDRIVSLETAPQTEFIRLDFDHANYFKHSFGITTPSGPVEEIIMEFDEDESPYIRSLPIHPSQQIIGQTDGTLTVSIAVIPSYELYEYILSKTPSVKVISPLYIADKVKEHLNKGRANYSKK